jgi:hypothetical protein
VANFYKTLMSQERVIPERIQKYTFKINRLRDINKNININYAITLEEVQKVLESMKDSSPGPNGLTIGFYRRYFPFFGKYLIRMWNNTSIPLSDTFNKIHIKLIPKNDDKIKSINSLRPISLTNFEYRIFTKVLTNRLNSVSFLMIQDHQTCSIVGRRMSDNITILRDLIEDSNRRQKDLYVISVDQKKAFDSVSHAYLFKILEHVGIGEFMTENIKRLYSHSFAHLIINRNISQRFDIKSGIKQGCALSMFLYILVIEELLIRIKKKDSIKGYLMPGATNSEIKSTAYADDVVGYVRDERSIREFFCEFEEWGDVSGASINKEKTKIMATHERNNRIEMKVLGVIFDRKGICQKNLELVENKLIQAINIWNTVKLNMLERIVVCKTFIFSKLLFILNFINASDKFVKKINKILFGFIWSCNIETISRMSLTLPYDDGGMSMVCLEARLNTVRVSEFLYISTRMDSAFYKLSVYWLKFQLRPLLANFNIIPTGSETERPPLYSDIVRSISLFKKTNGDLFTNNKWRKSKNIYTFFLGLLSKPPICQRNYFGVDWPKCFKNINHRKLSSDLRTFNYRVLNDGLSLDLKYPHRKKNKCALCKTSLETKDHIFLECNISKNLFKLVVQKYKMTIDESPSRESIYFFNDFEFDYINIISIYKLAIWQLRFFVLKNSVKNYREIFFNFYNFLNSKSKQERNTS